MSSVCTGQPQEAHEGYVADAQWTRLQPTDWLEALCAGNTAKTTYVDETYDRGTVAELPPRTAAERPLCGPFGKSQFQSSCCDTGSNTTGHSLIPSLAAWLKREAPEAACSIPIRGNGRLYQTCKSFPLECIGGSRTFAEPPTGLQATAQANRQQDLISGKVPAATSYVMRRLAFGLIQQVRSCWHSIDDGMWGRRLGSKPSVRRPTLV